MPDFLYEPSKCDRCGHSKDRLHYSIIQVKHDAMGALRQMFPNGEANELNFVLFSTSGVHGTYCTLEQIENSVSKYGYVPASDDNIQSRDDYVYPEVTVLFVHPRVVALRYGNAKISSLDDLEFLKRLRASSLNVVSKIGSPEEANHA